MSDPPAPPIRLRVVLPFALLGSVAGVALWAVAAAAIIGTVVLWIFSVLLPVLAAPHGPSGSADPAVGREIWKGISQSWDFLFQWGWGNAAVTGAAAGAVTPFAFRSFVRWIRWRRDISARSRADPSLKAVLLLPVSCKAIFWADLAFCVCQAALGFLVVAADDFLRTAEPNGGGILDVPRGPSRFLAAAFPGAALLGMAADCGLLSARRWGTRFGAGALAAAAVSTLALWREERCPVALILLRAAWNAVFVGGLIRFYGWRRRRPEGD